ncbi:hypothetical protein FSP39_009963 [Pinctada imbricata]|uniref:Spondin-like TSP1 domain-containing protein n=1 Tax=Pinctada imbricata TaxID=66713 RepID=A0AA89BKA1_PINIB|nr:hypothetical protein FSP39_009963 [Pinctada imbricata]
MACPFGVTSHCFDLRLLSSKELIKYVTGFLLDVRVSFSDEVLFHQEQKFFVFIKAESRPHQIKSHDHCSKSFKNCKISFHLRFHSSYEKRNDFKTLIVYKDHGSNTSSNPAKTRSPYPVVSDPYNTYFKQDGKDCVVSEWGPWSQCNALCGLGSQKRKRKPIRKRQHGGQDCPVLQEKRACVGDRCYEIQSVEYQGRELREVGQIIPQRFSSWRNSPEYSPKLDIRSNLQDPSNEVPTRLAYCATFKITETRTRCNTTVSDRQWANVMQPGTEVCVQCDPFAMSKDLGTRCIGHGVNNHETKWKAVHVPYCNGKWVMISKHKECTCHLNPGFDFILV